MNRKWIVISTAAAVVAGLIVATLVFRDRSSVAATQAVQSNIEALVRPHSPVYGNVDAKVTIVEFFDPACETCRDFYPIVKRMVNSSFGQVRLVMRYAPLHQGSDTAVKILEAARKQDKYWEVVEKTLAYQPMWAAHGNPQPELIWEMVTDLKLDMAKARADAQSADVEQILRQDMADMTALNVQKTPGFFVNGRPLENFGEDQFKALVQEEVRRAYPK